MQETQVDGLVHAHLRLGQMEMVRHLAQGRLAEMIGPIGLSPAPAARKPTRSVCQGARCPSLRAER
jgi:hypothetical protein